MNILEDIRDNYLTLVKRFLPDHVHLAAEIGYQIELFLSQNEQFVNVRGLRLKQDGEIISETLYDIVKMEGRAKFSEDDLYLPLEDKELIILFGFDYDKG